MLLIALSSVANAGDRVVRAAGSVAVVGITTEQAYISATEQAKKEALRIAGVGESVKSTQAVMISSTRQLVASFATIELQGAVVEYTVLSKNVTVDRYGVPFCNVKISATVQHYKTSDDAEFTFNIGNLKGIYRQGERISFDFTPAKNGFLHIFLVGPNQEVDPVFPNEVEQSRTFSADSVVKFPISRTIVYTATKTTAEPTEPNFLIAVYTKTNIRFTKELTFDNVGGWINSIEPADKRVMVESIIITK